MSKVLFLSSLDTRSPPTKPHDFDEVFVQMGANTGNILFTHAIQTYLMNAGADHDVTFLSRTVPLEVDWTPYSHCVVNVANWLGVGTEDLLLKLADDFKAAPVPIFVIGLGVQVHKGGDPSFVREIRDEASAFIDSVLRTGGAFGLRGDFTAACFDELGFADSYTVTGCPSVYQLGATPPVRTDKVSRDNFRPALNGTRQMHDAILLKKARDFDAPFICQDSFARIALSPQSMTNAARRALLKMSSEALALILDDRLHAFLNLGDWVRFLHDRSINYVYGGRVHGSIAAIMAGIPAKMVVGDCRTHEIADYFGIPACKNEAFPTDGDLYEEYVSTDYREFLRNFPRRLRNFEAFLSCTGLPMTTVPKSEPVFRGAGGQAARDGIASAKLNRMIEKYLAFKPVPGGGRLLTKQRQFILLSRVGGSKML